MKRHLWILSSLSLVATGMTGRPAASAPPAASEQPDALAKQLFREQQYPAAAAEFERLWTEQSAPKYLFNAAMSREMMGHELQAFVHLHAFLAVPGLPEAEITRAQDRIRTLKARAIRLRVRVSPADLPAGTLTLNARRGVGPNESTSPSEVHLEPATLASLAVPGAPGAYDLPLEAGQWDLEFVGRGFEPGHTSVQAKLGPAYPVVVHLKRLSDVVDVTTEFMPAAALAAGVEVVLQGPAPVTRQRVERSPVTWRLKPGPWTLEANAPGYETARRGFTAGTEPVRLQVQLTRKRRDGRRLALGLGVAGGVMVVTGAVVLGVTGRNWNKRREDVLDSADAFATRSVIEKDQQDKLDEWTATTGRLNGTWNDMNAGAAILGAGLGLSVGSLASLLPHTRRAWIAQIAVGATTGAGMLLVHKFVVVENLHKHELDLKSEAINTGDISMTSRAQLGTDRWLGAGVGLLIGMGSGLVIGGMAGLLHDRYSGQRHAMSRVTPYFSVNGAGLSIESRF